MWNSKPGTSLNVQHFVLRVLNKEFSVGPKPFGNGNDTEYGPDSIRFVGMPNLGGTDFRQFPDRPMVILLQPRRQFGIVALPASQFDDRDHRVGVPVNGAVSSMNPHEMRHACEGCFSHVSLMVKLVPKSIPRRLSGLLTLKLRKQWSGVALRSVPACQVVPAIVI